MNEKLYFKDKLVLKRNNISEREFNYTKIYDLSRIDEIPSLNQEKKILLLSSIKKILLCTNKYIDIFNLKEFIQYIIVSIGIFILYISILSPFYEIIIISEEKMKNLGDYTMINKLYHFIIGHILEIIFRIIFNYLRQKKTKKIMMYYAENELNKIRNEFNIFIDENNFDLTIKYRKDRYNNDLIEYAQDFQYVICYPNVRYYKWDENILNENEREICNNLKIHIKNIEETFVLKNYNHSIIILVLYLIMLFFLTYENLFFYYFITIVFFLYTKIASIFLSSRYKNFLIEHEYIMNHTFYLSKGYLVILNSAVIQIFKLNQNEYYQNKNSYEIYKMFFEKVERLNDKFSIFSIL